jgi:hypothetical protein
MWELSLSVKVNRLNDLTNPLTRRRGERMTEEFRTRIQRIRIARQVKEDAERTRLQDFDGKWHEVDGKLKSVMNQVVEEFPGSKVAERDGGVILAIDLLTNGPSIIFTPNRVDQNVSLVGFARGSKIEEKQLTIWDLASVEDIERIIADFLQKALT